MKITHREKRGAAVHERTQLVKTFTILNYLLLKGKRSREVHSMKVKRNRKEKKKEEERKKNSTKMSGEDENILQYKQTKY